RRGLRSSQDADREAGYTTDTRNSPRTAAHFAVAAASRMIHRVCRTVFDLRLADAKNAFRHRQRIEELFHRAVVPVLEEAFDATAPHDEVLDIDRLEIDLGRVDPDGLDERLLRDVVLRQLEGRLQRIASSDREVKSVAASALDTLVAFLET